MLKMLIGVLFSIGLAVLGIIKRKDYGDRAYGLIGVSILSAILFLGQFVSMF